ncbi:Crp/Fnr family transcriptional regulator [Algoriphagus confluentis]|uniref:Crp/Fnr family transcriptional regulator n=1 Tax=Algoriphagus confluentis TaxID=1697556 RepID=A0ABQ6PS09_9BACT|nr:Crp/Fnr family transcriptional regulator [Algoriphagus confluentis]
MNRTSIENKFGKFLKENFPISDAELASSLTRFSNLPLKKSEFFVQQDEICRSVGFILKGTLRTFYLDEKGEEITSCFCAENNFSTSFKSFIFQKPSSLSIQAMEDTELMVIDFDHLQTLYKLSSTWQMIGRVLAEKEYLAMERYASFLNSETAKEKYLRLIKEQPAVLNLARVEDIASYLGVTRRTLSRIRKEISLKN